MNADALFPITNRKRGDDPVPRPCFVIRCSACGREEIMAAPHGCIPSQQVQNHFAHRHWQVNRTGKHLCGSCAARARQAHIEK